VADCDVTLGGDREQNSLKFIPSRAITWTVLVLTTAKERSMLVLSRRASPSGGPFGPRRFTIHGFAADRPLLPVAAFVACDSPCPRPATAAQRRDSGPPPGSRAKPHFDPVLPHRCAFLLRSRTGPNIHVWAFATMLLTHVAILDLISRIPTPPTLERRPVDGPPLGAPAPSRASRRLPLLCSSVSTSTIPDLH